MSKTIARLIRSGSVLLLAGCSILSPLQGYSGPLRSEGETAFINVDSSSVNDRTNLQISSVTVDSYSLSGVHQGITVLPGSHRIRFDWTLDDQSDSDSGLNLVWKKSGHCDLNLTAQPGQKYLAYASVQDEGSWVSNPRVQVEVRDASSTFALRQLERPTPCTYSGRSVGSYLDLSK